MTDWQAWHSAYDDPSSSLARRLGIVRRRVAEALEAVSGDSVTKILSLCSGDGRDLLPVLAESARPAEAVLVEKTPALADAARRSVAELGLERVTVIAGDAGDPASYVGWPPVDLLLLCGIFGNVADADIKATVESVPALLRDGGIVIWTRGNMHPPDMRPTIRGWIANTGLREVAFDLDTDPTGFGVGVATKPPGLEPDIELPGRLFSFIR